MESTSMSPVMEHLMVLTWLCVVVAAALVLLTVLTCGCSAQLMKRYPLLDAGLQRLLLALTVISIYLASTLASITLDILNIQ